MTSPKVKLEGKKIAEKVMEFIDMNSFEPIFKVIKKVKTTTCISER